MRYKIFTLRVKFERQTPKAYDFSSLEEAIEAAWMLKDCEIVKYINLKSEWREVPEWVVEVAKSLAGLT